MFKTKTWLLPALGLFLAGAAVAQTAVAQTAEPKFYKLDFTVKEVEAGKTVNSRVFSTMLPVQIQGTRGEQASIRTGSRVPLATGASTQYIDLGVNLDLRELHEPSPGEVSLYISADISSSGQENPASAPVIRQNKWTGAVLAPVKKPTVVFASDDLSSKRQVQLELTATPVK